MPETIMKDYQVSSEGAVRHWEVPYVRLENTSPVETNPAAVLSLVPGDQLTGTVLTIDATDSIAVIDFTCSMVYQKLIRNVLTYADAAEATWGPINLGDKVYYDRSFLVAGVALSTSPLDNGGVANPEFGRVVLNQDECAADFEVGAAQIASTHTLAIMQFGAGS